MSVSNQTSDPATSKSPTRSGKGILILYQPNVKPIERCVLIPG